MNRGTFEKVVLSLLLLAVLIFGYSAIRALDSLRFEVRELRREVVRVATATPLTRTAFAMPGSVAVTPVEAGSNASFFAADAPMTGSLTLALGADTGNLNFLINNDSAVAELASLCTSTLAQRNWAHPERFDPLLAESWSVDNDQKTIRVRLRRGVLWQSFTDPETHVAVPSREVTAQDVVFFLDVVRNEAVNCAALRVYYQNLESARALNDYELEIRWSKPYYRSLELTLGLMPLPRHFYCPDNREFDPLKFNEDHARNRMLVGCGAYELVEWQKDQRFRLRRFDNYFGNALGMTPPLRELTLEIVKAPNTRLQMLLAGSLGAMALQPEQWARRGAEKPFSNHVMTIGERSADFPLAPGETLRRVKYLSNSYFYIGYNLRLAPFNDRKVRQALTLLTDRERILRDVYCGLGKVISGPFFYDSPYYDKSIAPWPFDPQRAAELLREAGFRDSDGDGVLDRDGKKFEFTAMQVANNPIQEKILTIWKEDLARAGIELKIAIYEWPVYIQKIESREFEVCSLGWAMPYESDPYQVWHSSQAEVPGGSNHIGFQNAEADRLIEAIRTSFNFEDRVALCHEFQALLHEEQPYTFLVVPEALQAVAGRYENISVFPLGTEMSSWYERIP